MLKLLKYEFRKTAFPKLVLFAFILIMEGIFLYGCLRNDGDTKTLGVILFVMSLMFGFLLIGLMSLVTLHKDMNTRQGYMLFMTPNSTYKILGAKVIECCLTLLATVCLECIIRIFNGFTRRSSSPEPSCSLRASSSTCAPTTSSATSAKVRMTRTITCRKAACSTMSPPPTTVGS